MVIEGALEALPLPAADDDVVPPLLPPPQAATAASRATPAAKSAERPRRGRSAYICVLFPARRVTRALACVELGGSCLMAHRSPD